MKKSKRKEIDEALAAMFYKPSQLDRIPPPYNLKVPKRWMNKPWHEVITVQAPVIKLMWDENSKSDWKLFLMIEQFADEMVIPFVDGVSWVLRRTLGDRFEDARQMSFEQRPWDEDVRHICRVLALVVCKNFGPDHVHTIEHVDGMIEDLLLNEEEMYLKSTAANVMPC